MWFFFSTQGFLVGDNFQELHTKLSTLTVSAACNSSISQLFINIFGRSNFGGGLLKIQTYEILDIIIPNPLIYPESINNLLKINSDFDINSEERQQLDQITMELLGFDKTISKGISLALQTLVNKRLEKSKSK